MRVALGERGADLIALGIAVSALGFLSQGMLTTPRVYFAMAEDRLFFRRIAEVSPRTRVPVFAILLQGAAAIVIALTGTYDQISPTSSRSTSSGSADRRRPVRVPPPVAGQRRFACRSTR